MDAKQIKPYTFWIVCGVIVVIELGLILFWPITDEIDRAPEDVKNQLDQDFTKLDDLYKRAGKTPTGVFDAENPDDIKRLTKDYLLTPKWKDVLQPHVNKYKEQQAAIRKDLSTRSAILREPVADSGDLFAWYNAYVGKTKEVMIALRNGRALIIDETKKEESDFENGADVRNRVGFFTKVERTPEAAEHPTLTARFRIMQKISEALLASGSNSLPNPALKSDRTAELEEKRPAHIKEAQWKRSGDPSKVLSLPIAEIADAHELTLTLQGSTSSLIAAEAAIEGISQPVMIVAGGKLSARGPQPAGARKGLIDEPMTLELTIAVIDFTRMPTTATVEAAAGGTKK
jgi:hypothetical protein